MFNILNRKNISTIFTPSTMSACVLWELGLLQLSGKEKLKVKDGCLLKHHLSFSFNLTPHVGKTCRNAQVHIFIFIFPELPLSLYLIGLHTVRISSIIGKGQIETMSFNRNRLEKTHPKGQRIQ